MRATSSERISKKTSDLFSCSVARLKLPSHGLHASLCGTSQFPPHTTWCRSWREGLMARTIHLRHFSAKCAVFSATETDFASASSDSIGHKIVASKAMPYLRKECKNVKLLWNNFCSQVFILFSISKIRILFTFIQAAWFDKFDRSMQNSFLSFFDEMFIASRRYSALG